MQALDPLVLELKGQILIEASAGTGKTWSIALLFLRLLLENNHAVDEILVLTFTKAATAELRERVRSRIREALNELELSSSKDKSLQTLLSTLPDPQQARQRLEDALVRMDEAAIYTIHGFCQRMLQEHAFASGSPFEMEFIESEALLRRRIIEDFWRRNFYACEKGEAEWVVDHWKEPEDLLKELGGHLSRPEVTCVPEIGKDEILQQQSELELLFHQVQREWQHSGKDIVGLLNTTVQNKHLSANKNNGYSPDRLTTAIIELGRLSDADKMPLKLARHKEIELFTQSKIEASLLKKAQGIAPQHPFFEHFEDFSSAHKKMSTCKRFVVLLEARRYLFQELDRRKKQRAQLYFNDLLIQLEAALKAPEGCVLAKQISQRFPAILVDEFQDTDSLQYAIFKAIFSAQIEPAEQSPPACLILIGDPKQAIYGFRGADVFTYMAAARNTAQKQCFTLDTNYRSTPAMVEAVNRLFNHQQPFIFDQIGYTRVNASDQHTEKLFRLDDSPQPPLTCLLLENDQNKGLSKQAAKAEAARYCAQQIAVLLQAGRDKYADLDSEPLEPKDVAVLVRTHDEASLVRKQLSELKITSVYSGRESIYSSEQAKHLSLVLTSLLDSSDEARVRTALTTDLLGYSAEQLDELRRDEKAWEACLEKMERYRDSWLKLGFSRMFHKLIEQEQLVPRLSHGNDGERALTNFIHLSERLQAAEPQTQGAEGLLRWFNEQIQSPEPDAEEQQLRLESDENLVKIITIHKAKGLEYPIVFLPFLWSARTCKIDEVLAFHHPAKPEQLKVDLGTGIEEHFELAEKERLAEDLRLLYVAFTRAKYACYFCWGHINNMHESALHYLLHTGPELSTEQITDDLATRLGSDRSELYIQPGAGRSSPIPLSQTLPGGKLQAKTFTGKIDAHPSIISYSNLAGSTDSPPEQPDYDQYSIVPAPIERRDDIFGFPKGAKAGVCLHSILEEISFTGLTDTGQKVERRRVIELHISRAGIQDKWRYVVEQWLPVFLNTKISPGFSLAQLEPANRLNEMAFYFSLDSLHWKDFNRALKKYSYAPLDRYGQHQGLMRGFIDLVYRHNGRYYIADYKSNYLGIKPEDYQAEKLLVAMQVHRYDLQYLIYTLALHRYLSSRIQGYAYDQHFGGVDYLFLRGMHPAYPRGTGIYHDRPPFDLITALDQCCSPDHQ